jgi:hypothetical protein
VGDERRNRVSVLKYKDPETGEWKQAGAVKVIGISDAVVEPLEVDENGTYTPPDGVTGFAPVVVDVQPNIQPLTITENGTYTAQDGVDGYSPITVEVEGGGGEDLLGALIDRSITEANSGATSIGMYAFYDCRALTSANIPNAKSIGEYAFIECRALKSANFPNVTSIGIYAFSNCISLTSASFPNLRGIVGNVFSKCRALESANFPNVTSIALYAFNECRNLTSANFPNVTSIGNNAFYECRALKSANFPSVTSIGGYVFSNCYSLISVILRSETVCTLGSNVFSKCCHILGTTDSTYNPNGHKDGYIYVPSTLVDTYKVATNWSAHASQIMPYVDTLAELADIDATTYNKAYVGETENEYTHNGTDWEEYTR